ncbi:unnamed protein product [Symbiodinium microadriaticum]|nr:unnamed protein product [Symbiodinium microadriaticum]
MASESDDAASYAAIAKAATSPEDVEEALQAAEAAEQLAQTKGDAKGEACAAHSIALLKFRLEDFEEALAAGQRSCGLFRELKLEHLEARARAGLADAALRRRPPSEAEGKRFVDEAMDLAEGALQTFERLDDSSGRALALAWLPASATKQRILPGDPPDFSLPTYWLAHPVHWPRRVAENLPKTICNLRPDGTKTCEATDQYSDDQSSEVAADLFYLHGTMEGIGNRASIDRYDKEAFQSKAFNTRHQMTIVTAFTSACRAYAPLYRQAAMGGSWDLAYQDVLAAFEQFLSEVGSQRPFVLAGHSQGSLHIIRLVKERIQGDPALMRRLCAVHAPGMGQWMEPSPLPVDRAPQDPPTAPAVAIWAAATPEAEEAVNGKRDFANPCAWTKGEHLGVLLPDDETKLPVLQRGLVQGAEVVDGLLRVHPAISEDGILTKLHMGHHDRDYHAYDVHLFWANVRERVKQQAGGCLPRVEDLKVRAWMARGEHARAQEALEQTLESARGREDKVAEAAALQSLVGVHLARKTATAAIDCAQEAAKVQEMLGNQAAEAGAWHLAAQLLLKASNAPEALRCAQAARRVHKGCSVSATEEATVLQTLSAAHLASGDATKALEVANAGRELCKQEAAEGGEAVCALRAARVRSEEGLVFKLPAANLWLIWSSSEKRIVKQWPLRRRKTLTEMVAARRSSALSVLAVLCLVAAPSFVGFRQLFPSRGLALQAEPEPAYKGDKPKHPILDSGCTELMQAAYKGDTEKVKALVDGGADVNQQDAYGWTAVRYAVRNRQLKSTETLLDLGADVNIASKTGRTPLMSAAGNGLEELCKLLVEQGDADIMAADEGGKTAYDLAMRTGPLGSDLIRDLVAGGQTPGAGEEGWKRNPGA